MRLALSLAHWVGGYQLHRSLLVFKPFNRRKQALSKQGFCFAQRGDERINFGVGVVHCKGRAAC